MWLSQILSYLGICPQPNKHLGLRRTKKCILVNRSLILAGFVKACIYLVTTWVRICVCISEFPYVVANLEESVFAPLKLMLISSLIDVYGSATYFLSIHWTLFTSPLNLCRCSYYYFGMPMSWCPLKDEAFFNVLTLIFRCLTILLMCMCIYFCVYISATAEIMD